MPRHGLLVPTLVVCLLGLPLVACGPPMLQSATGADMQAQSPLGPSYILLPLPNEETDLLGRVLEALPEPGRSLEEVARPNPCAEHLTEQKESPLASSYEDALELSASASAQAMLGSFGFSGDVEHATHFVYKLAADRRVSRTDTVAYTECCKETGCGYGFVAALVHGEGEYATGQESSMSSSVDYAIASVGGGARLKALHKRKVKGFLAAVVRVTDASKGAELGPFGVGGKLAIDEESLSDVIKPIYERSKISVEVVEGDSWVFKDGTGGEISENEFVRRFRSATGSEELDDYDRHRHGVSSIILNTCGLLGGAVSIAGVVIQTEVDNQNAGGIVAAGIGGAFALGCGIPGIILVANVDGSTEDHYLDEAQARLYARRYNRAVLRKTVRDAQTQERKDVGGAIITPLIGPMGAGVRVVW